MNIRNDEAKENFIWRKPIDGFRNLAFGLGIGISLTIGFGSVQITPALAQKSERRNTGKVLSSINAPAKTSTSGRKTEETDRSRAEEKFADLVAKTKDIEAKFRTAEEKKDIPALKVLCPKLADLYIECGDMLMAGGLLDGAGARYFAAVKLAPDNSRALSGLGYVLLQQNLNDQAAVTLQKCISTFPEKLDPADKVVKYMATNNLGIALIEIARIQPRRSQRTLYTKAARTLKDAISQMPDLHFAYFNLGRVYEGREAWAMALDNYKLAAEKNPRDIEAHMAMLRIAKEHLRDEKMASSIVRKALEMNPNAPGLHFLRGEDLARSGKTETSFFNYWREFFVNPATPWAQEALQKIKEQMVVEFDNIDREDTLHLFMKGYKFFQEKNYDKAFEFYNLASKRDPSNPVLRLMMADTLKQQEKFKEAIDAYVEAIQASDKKLSFLYYELANTLMKMKQYDRAADIFSDSVALNPFNVQAYVNWAMCHFELKEYSDASAILFKATTLFPDSTFVHFNLGKALLHSGKVNLAKQEFEHVLNKKTGDDIKKASQAYLKEIDDSMKKNGEKKSSAKTGTKARSKKSK
ncbi:MAG: hypothetical protein CVV64_18190 [Candidatus Wallbacteria bacterium HGW-Wallbacteria-1]|jgi:tetratricopeptide (TPR) repeat protein|uniref:Uncharacterized protein n=1 Tax=Candidatus Wallbacteria bacterium HGW-Wallbacteria-1 TaxID=2013854 RepID=A0A2N1PJR4_9BACT|nr:MAG: hypothetical protein CVV64_18190 [Candidatus Wallbacteria bacterium HGW-Wallbacteria-1]